MRKWIFVFPVVIVATYGVAQNHRGDLRETKALAALNAELAKEGKDCPDDAKNQHDDTICSGEVAKTAGKNLTTFYDYVRTAIGDDAGKILEESQKAWLDYRKKACDAVFELYKHGSIRYAAESRCETRLTRERMRDLDTFYEGPLHH